MIGSVATKAVVLAAGTGRRMRNLDDTHLTSAQEEAARHGLKAMMPLDRGRPFLDHVLSAFADAGGRDICIVVGEGHEAIRRYYERERPPKRLRVEFAFQDSPQGTAHALLSAEPFAGSDPFLVLNADNLYPESVLRAIIDLDGPGLPVFERDVLIVDSRFPLERVAAFALLSVDRNGFLESIHEKPGLEVMTAAGPHALVSMNLWRFDFRIFQACRMVPRSTRGELELPQAVGLALAEGVRFRAVSAHGAILDLSSRADVARVAERLAGLEAMP